MTLIELIERLMPYFPQLPPEVAEFFGGILLTGDPGKVDTYDLRMIMYRLPHTSRKGRGLENDAALSLLNAIHEPQYAASHYLRFAKDYLDKLTTQCAIQPTQIPPHILKLVERLLKHAAVLHESQQQWLADIFLTGKYPETGPSKSFEWTNTSSSPYVSCAYWAGYSLCMYLHTPTDDYDKLDGYEADARRYLRYLSHTPKKRRIP